MLNISTQVNALTPLRQPYLLALFKNIVKRFVWRNQSKQQGQGSSTKHPQDQLLQAFFSTINRGFTVHFLNTERSQAVTAHHLNFVLPTASSCFYLKNECTLSSVLLSFLPWLKKWEIPPPLLVTSLKSGPSDGTCAAAGCSPTCASSIPWPGSLSNAELSIKAFLYHAHEGCTWRRFMKAHKPSHLKWQVRCVRLTCVHLLRLVIILLLRWAGILIAYLWFSW